MVKSASKGVLPAVSPASWTHCVWLATALWVVPVAALGQESVPAYDRIEEDWELIVGEPDPDTNAPQLINVLSSRGDLEGDYAVLEINHITQPDYYEGGLQLQLWSDEVYRSNYTPQPSRVLTVPGETIRYTLAMSIENGQLKFRVRNGTSSSWGSFGGDNFLVQRNARIPNLATYSTAVSTANSRVAFAAHRVEKFALKRVRYYRNGELLRTDETVRQVHPPAE